MDDILQIPVTYKGQEIDFEAKLLNMGYMYKIQVDVYGQQVLFEPDEERNFRAMLDPNDLEKGNYIEVGLLKAIAEVLESVVK
jgi:hypothetical protein